MLLCKFRLSSVAEAVVLVVALWSLAVIANDVDPKTMSGVVRCVDHDSLDLACPNATRKMIKVVAMPCKYSMSSSLILSSRFHAPLFEDEYSPENLDSKNAAPSK